MDQRSIEFVLTYWSDKNGNATMETNIESSISDAVFFVFF